jgi:hypothetical protein
VTKDGKLYAVDGHFSGDITGGTIRIGGTAASPNFYVDRSGNVTMTGGIVLNGNITWGSSTSPT